MKKKSICLAFALALCLSLIACGASKEITCRNCSEEISSESNFCSHCGAAVTQENLPDNEDNTTESASPDVSPTPSEDPAPSPSEEPAPSADPEPSKEPESCDAGHSWKKATCTAPKTCSVCKATEGKAAGHSWKNATCTAPKTCSVCKATEGKATGHSWKNSTCTAPKTCSVCKATEGNAAGHNWKNATCTAPKTCSVCMATEGNAAGHNWKNATCIAPKTCAACGKTEGGLGKHVYKETARANATIDQDGFVTYTCSICGDHYDKILYATGSLGLAYEHNGDGTCTVVGIGTCTDRHVVIPERFEGAKVTAIADKAFYGCSAMKEITIPQTVSSIGTQVFYKCPALHTVYYNSSYYDSNNPFLEIPSIKTVVFGGSKVLLAICKDAANIEEVVILNGFTSLGDYAFSGCSSLTGVVIPDSVTDIKRYAFSDCSRLADIVIPDSVTGIGDYAFSGCSRLTRIVIPDSVTGIGRYAFSDCSRLSSIVIPDSVTDIASYAFSGCIRLTRIDFGGTKAQWRAIGGMSNTPDGCTVYCTDGEIE